MTDASLVIAYRNMGDEARRKAFDYVVRWYRPLGWPIVVEAGTSDATFTRASAINTAVRRAVTPVIVQVDPDSLVPLARLRQAVTMAAAAPGLVIPHDWYLYLTEAATERVLAGDVNPIGLGPDNCDDHGRDGSGNVVVFSIDTWTMAGGFDERFQLWGGDDAAFRYACEAMCAPTRRVIGDMVHLWHPRLPQSEPGHPGYTAQFAILAQYRDAAAIGPDAVRELVRSR